MKEFRVFYVWMHRTEELIKAEDAEDAKRRIVENSTGEGAFVYRVEEEEEFQRAFKAALLKGKAKGKAKAELCRAELKAYTERQKAELLEAPTVNP